MLKINYKSNGIISLFSMKVIIPLLVLVLVILLIIIPIKIPYTIKVPGKVFAAEEWIIMKGRDGQLITIQKDYRNGISKSYSVTEFERGDNAYFRFKSNLRPGSIISNTDTIGSIFSNELEARLAALRGQLMVTNELLNSSLSGEKESLIEEARDNLEYAKKRTEVERIIFSRQEKLFEKGLISEQAYDSSKYTVQLSEISIAIAEAQLQTVLTGEKREQIELIKSQISAFEKEIDILGKRSANFNLTSPVNGYIRGIPMGDTLMIISDTSQYVIRMPVPLVEQQYLEEQANVCVILPIHNGDVNASLVRINNTVEYLFSKPVVYAIAVSEGSNNILMAGLIVKCSIECSSIKIVEHIKRIFHMEVF